MIVILGYVFRCAKCRTRRSIRNGTFFQQSHFSLSQIFELMYYWSRQEDSIDKIMHELEIGLPSTIVDWKNFCRDKCAQYFINNPMRIGGSGHIVEIDESCFGKRKYNRGRMIQEQQWVFGSIDREYRECFMVSVDRRDAQTLLPIINQFILPGTTILSDEWRAYTSLRNNPDFIHRAVNHSINFVDPNTGAHTQNIENTWMRSKRKQKKQCGLHRSLFDSYLQEFMWRQMFGDKPLENLVRQIATLYPVA